MARRSTLLTYSDEGDDSNTSYDNFCVSRVRNKEITRLFIFQEVGEISIGDRFFDSCRCRSIRWLYYAMHVLDACALSRIFYIAT